MITSNSDIPYLGIAFADLLDIDIIQNLKEGFGMMGMRFAGKPNAGIRGRFLDPLYRNHETIPKSNFTCPL